MTITDDQLHQLTNECNNYMATTGRKLFPSAKADELRELGAKRCSVCKSVKRLSAFTKDSRNRDGLSSKCSDCDRKKSAEYHAANPEYFREYREANREARLEYQREYRRANADKINEHKREYNHSRYWDPEDHYRLADQLRNGYRRAIQAGNTAEWITPEQLLTYWSAKGIDPLVCYLTGEKLTPLTRSIDHVLAISNDGKHTVDNLMPCTELANKKKQNLDPNDAKQRLSDTQDA